MRLIPLTWKGKLKLLGVVVLGMLALFLVAAALFPDVMFLILGVLFALYGISIALTVGGVIAYLLFRRRQIAALRNDWVDD